ncbi:MAG TPA: DinB family protein [Candidatus Hypogeohydataceae bacterium YC40]
MSEAGSLLRVRPEPGEWSVLECVGHIVDSELVAGARERWIVSSIVFLIGCRIFPHGVVCYLQPIMRF